MSQVFAGLVAAGAFQPVLGDDFTFERADAYPDHIELEIQDRAHHHYGIRLALTESKGSKPDKQGRRFLFYLTAALQPPDAHATQALLAIAALLDEAVPETALSRCAGGDASHVDRRYPRALILGSAVLQMMVLVAAVWFGLRSVRQVAEHRTANGTRSSSAVPLSSPTTPTAPARPDV